MHACTRAHLQSGTMAPPLVVSLVPLASSRSNTGAGLMDVPIQVRLLVICVTLAHLLNLMMRLKSKSVTGTLDLRRLYYC